MTNFAQARDGFKIQRGWAEKGAAKNRKNREEREAHEGHQSWSHTAVRKLRSRASLAGSHANIAELFAKMMDPESEA